LRRSVLKLSAVLVSMKRLSTNHWHPTTQLVSETW
jgi:hypothetical protein